jgi:hypothetical protein
LHVFAKLFEDRLERGLEASKQTSKLRCEAHLVDIIARVSMPRPDHFRILGAGISGLATTRCRFVLSDPVEDKLYSAKVAINGNCRAPRRLAWCINHHFGKGKTFGKGNAQHSTLSKAYQWFAFGTTSFLAKPVHFQLVRAMGLRQSARSMTWVSGVQKLSDIEIDLETWNIGIVSGWQSNPNVLWMCMGRRANLVPLCNPEILEELTGSRMRDVSASAHIL